LIVVEQRQQIDCRGAVVKTIPEIQGGSCLCRPLWADELDVIEGNLILDVGLKQLNVDDELADIFGIEMAQP
jgi:hypothetical protein